MSIKLTYCTITAAAFAFMALSAPAQAQTLRTWVSGLGDDANFCTRTAPCKTFSGAMSKTAAGGEINCLDPGGYGAVTINKSLTIDCHDVFGSALVQGANSINVALDSTPNMIVRIRNVNINGLLASPIGISITGTNSGSANNAVSIEDCLIDGFTQFGISDTAIAGRLYVKNTVIRNGFSTGVGIASSSGVSAVRATFENVAVFDWNTGYGIGNGAQVLLKTSTSAGNTAAGVQADGGALVAISSSTISGNGTGILVNAGGTVRVGDSDIAFNTTGLTGTIQSFVNNRITNNGAGGTINPVTGGVTNPQGLQ
jgi:hypothetical protein